MYPINQHPTYLKIIHTCSKYFFRNYLCQLFITSLIIVTHSSYIKQTHKVARDFSQNLTITFILHFPFLTSPYSDLSA